MLVETAHKVFYMLSSLELPRLPNHEVVWTTMSSAASVCKIANLNFAVLF